MSQQHPTPELRILGEALLQAWRSRSQVERHAFEQRIGVTFDRPVPRPADPPAVDDIERGAEGVQARPTYPRYPSPAAESESVAANDGHVRFVEIDWADSDVAEIAKSFERIAAVSGAINPLQLKADEEGPLAEIALDRIAARFDRTRTSSGWAWTLRSERRAAVLTTLSKSVLVEELRKAAKIETDPAGNAFRILLRNGVLKEAEASLDAEVVAHSWLDLVEPEKRQLTRSLRLQNARVLILEAFDHLLIEGFVGRKHDIDRLRAFAEGLHKQEMSQILSVTGIGGVGKSSLLAAALRPVIEKSFENERAPIVISIDFDRRAHANGTELELTFEFSRQLELYYPAIGGNLDALRESVMRDRITRGELNREVFDSESDSIERHSFEFQNRAAPILQRAGVGTRPVLLILDTFEEWQRSRLGRGDTAHPIRRFLSWLAEVQSAWGIQAGVIVCGRTPVAAESNFASGGVIALGDLKRLESVDLLRRQGLAKREAQALARIAGGNPLALKLAIRYYKRLPAAARSAFLAEGAQELEGLDAALRQGVLYRRFLDHISDPQARKLAHPGLALRRVTPLLVQHVLAGPCELGSLNVVEAEDLLERLAREVWLVEGRWPVITHRPELRRVMLRAMNSDPLQRVKIHAVHLAALHWYEGRKDASEEDLAEALYHRLSIADLVGAEIDFAAIPPRLLQRVAQSAEDFETKLRAELLFRAGRSIGSAEAAVLAPRERQAWAQDKAASLVRSGQPERALALWQQLGDGASPGSWYAAATFQAFDLPQVEMLFKANPAPSGESLRYDFLLSFTLQIHQPDIAARYRHWLRQALTRQLSDAEEGKSFAVALEALYFESIVDPLAALGHRRHMRPIAPDQDFSASSQQYIRMRQLFRDSLYMPNLKRFKVVLANLFCPSIEFIEKVSVKLYRSGLRAEGISRFLQEFSETLSKGASSDQLLGQWADRFAGAIGTDLGNVKNDTNYAAAVLDELRSDDPEWRVPIRTALVDSARLPSVRERLAHAVSDILGSATPTDLRPFALTDATQRSGRKAWGRAVEYLDRANRLGEFMGQCLETGNSRLEEVAGLYGRWDHLRRESEI